MKFACVPYNFKGIIHGKNPWFDFRLDVIKIFVPKWTKIFLMDVALQHLNSDGLDCILEFIYFSWEYAYPGIK